MSTFFFASIVSIINHKYRYGFPKYNPLSATLLRLGYNNQTGPQAVNPIQYDLGCDISTTVSEMLTKVSSLL